MKYLFFLDLFGKTYGIGSLCYFKKCRDGSIHFREIYIRSYLKSKFINNRKVSQRS